MIDPKRFSFAIGSINALVQWTGAFLLIKSTTILLDESVWYSLVKCSLCAMTLTLFKGKKSMDFIAISSYLMA